jgi:hypothetical protein
MKPYRQSARLAKEQLIVTLRSRLSNFEELLRKADDIKRPMLEIGVFAIKAELRRIGLEMLKENDHAVI